MIKRSSGAAFIVLFLAVLFLRVLAVALVPLTVLLLVDSSISVANFTLPVAGYLLAHLGAVLLSKKFRSHLQAMEPSTLSVELGQFLKDFPHTRVSVILTVGAYLLITKPLWGFFGWGVEGSVQRLVITLVIVNLVFILVITVFLLRRLTRNFPSLPLAMLVAIVISLLLWSINQARHEHAEAEVAKLRLQETRLLREQQKMNVVERHYTDGDEKKFGVEREVFLDALTRMHLILLDMGFQLEDLSLEKPILELEIDDLDYVELLFDVEIEFGIEVPDDAAEGFLSIGDLLEFVLGARE